MRQPNSYHRVQQGRGAPGKLTPLVFSLAVHGVVGAALWGVLVARDYHHPLEMIPVYLLENARADVSVLAKPAPPAPPRPLAPPLPMKNIAPARPPQKVAKIQTYPQRVETDPDATGSTTPIPPPDAAAGDIKAGAAAAANEVTASLPSDSPSALDEVEVAPRVILRIAPLYPQQARERGEEAEVLLRAVIDQQGRVEPSVTILKSAPDFDGAALAAFSQWRFEPGRDENGRAVRVIVEVPIRFVLR